ncbi:MAG: hypothetical protein KDD69_00265 [Bdellovibrionales bacterium]|nr:hypothetical protein [Bdellovibrionales bacterium]
MNSPLSIIPGVQSSEENSSGYSEIAPLQALPAVVADDSEKSWTLDVLARREMAALFHSIEAARADTRPLCIQFVGSVSGEGTSSIAEGLARFVAESVGKRVLLLGEVRPNATDGMVLQDAIIAGTDLNDLLSLNEQPNLTLAYLAREEAALARLADAETSSALIARLKERFPWVIIDSLPLARSSAGLLIAKNADGVILVVEADRTRKRTVMLARDRVVDAGGNLLGVVFNKRQTHLPARLRRCFGN